MDATVTNEELQPRTLREIIDEIREHQDVLKGLNKQAKELEDTINDMIENELRPRMLEVGTDTASGDVGIAQITPEEIPKVDDWDAFYNYIKENNAFHLMQRRPAVKALKELREIGEPAPGTGVFTKYVLTVKPKR